MRPHRGRSARRGHEGSDRRNPASHGIAWLVHSEPESGVQSRATPETARSPQAPAGFPARPRPAASSGRSPRSDRGDLPLRIWLEKSLTWLKTALSRLFRSGKRFPVPAGHSGQARQFPVIFQPPCCPSCRRCAGPPTGATATRPPPQGTRSASGFRSTTLPVRQRRRQDRRA